jgi:hypothetical protein
MTLPDDVQAALAWYDADGKDEAYPDLPTIVRDSLPAEVDWWALDVLARYVREQAAMTDDDDDPRSRDELLAEIRHLTNQLAHHDQIVSIDSVPLADARANIERLKAENATRRAREKGGGE